MTPRKGAPGTARPLDREARVWRLLVALQLLVAVAILVGLVTVAVVGAAGSLFVQRGI